jgi:hypothetical protein
MTNYSNGAMKGMRNCVGEMFPDLDTMERNRQVAGRAFTVLIESHGIGVSARRVKVNHAGWEQCRACEDYRDCYDLGMAKLALGTALRART